MKERINKAIELLYQDRVKEAYEIIAALVGDIEGILEGLSAEKYPRVISMLSGIVQLMTDNRSMELAQTLQFDFLPFVFDETIELTREQAAAKGFMEQYREIEENAVVILFGIFTKSYMDAIKDCCTGKDVILYQPDGWNGDDDGISNHIYLLADFCPEVDRKDGHRYKIDELPLVLKKCINETNKNVVYISALPGAKEAYEASYNWFREQIQYRLEMVSINSYTAKTLGHIVVRNNLKNFPYLLKGYCVDTFVNGFSKDMPAVIVSAGPSLAKNAEKLREIKGKALIVCVDTAAHTLLAKDIVPDFLVTVDPRKELSLFDDERIKDIPLIGSSDMSYEVLKKLHCKNLVMASVKNPFIKHLYEEKKHHVDELESGGSVATFAYSFCKYIGIKKIAFVGQDLALTGDKIYAGKEKIDLEHFQRELIKIERYGGGEIYTTRDYYSYLIWFEQQIQINRDMEHLNATEGGGRIHGAEECTLDEVIRRWALDCDDIGEQIRKRMIPVFKNSQDTIEEIRSYKNGFSELAKQFEEAVRASKYMQNPDASKEKWESAKKEIELANQLFDDSMQAFLVLREVDATNLEEYMEICSLAVSTGGTEQYELLERYFTCLLGATKNIEDILSETDCDQF